MNFEEYVTYDATGLAELVKRKEVTANELVAIAIARIQQVNPMINAVITPMYDIARTYCETQTIEGPFQGVPFLLKDLLSAYKGVPMSSGCRALQNFIPDYDSELVTRFKKAGLITTF